MSIYLPARTEHEIERSITHLDLDYELYRAKTERFVVDRGRVQRIKAISGGSGVTGTWAEVLYSNKFAYTAKNTFTTEFNIADTASGNPLFTLPAEFFLPSMAAGKALRIHTAGIQLGTGSTPPTWLWTYRLNPTLTPAVPPTGPIIAGGPAAITGTTTTNSFWEADFDIQFTLEAAAGNNSTLRGTGQVTSARGLVSPFAMDLFGGAASPGTVATFDWSVQNSLTVGITCGTSLAANQMQLIKLLVFGLN
jgi:hypothetical protein